jgi:hypothetical protein
VYGFFGGLWRITTAKQAFVFFNAYDIFGVVEIWVGVADLVVTFLNIWKQI